MNKDEKMNEVSRAQTFHEANCPSIDEENIRHLSIASIALLQKTGNRICQSLLNGEDINFDNREDLLEFIWTHTADKNEVIKAFLIYPSNPFILKNLVFSWGLELPNEELDKYLYAILTERELIRNSESEIVPDKNSKKK